LTAPQPISGDLPSTTLFATLYVAIQQLVNRLITIPLRLKPVLDSQRKLLNLDPLPYGARPESFTYSPLLHIQASSPRLEFNHEPRSRSGSIPTCFVGPLVAPANQSYDNLPSWWRDLGGDERPIIGITQGTLAMDPTSLIIPAIQSFQDSNRVILVVISPHAASIAETTGHPKNAHFATFLPYHLLLPRLSLLITNGGYGSITQALSHGVPLLCAGQTEDKPDTAARVVWSGAGIDLKTDSPSAAQVREAADEILFNSSLRFKERARQVGDELSALGGAQKACDALENLGNLQAMPIHLRGQR
jgi:UDP:flavonoid glycosyltransferase YjiC (YdhE family)